MLLYKKLLLMTFGTTLVIYINMRLQLIDILMYTLNIKICVQFLLFLCSLFHMSEGIEILGSAYAQNVCNTT